MPMVGERKATGPTPGLCETELNKRRERADTHRAHLVVASGIRQETVYQTIAETLKQDHQRVRTP